MHRQDGDIYDFADFRLIPGERLLLNKGQPVSLPPKAFATLVMLVERHGHLVEKSELIERVWENAYVEEAAVSRCVWGIRNALGEDPKNKKFIQTVPKLGYRFVAEVTRSVSDIRNSNGRPIPGANEESVPVARSAGHTTHAFERGSGMVVQFRRSQERLAVLPETLSKPELKEALGGAKTDLTGGWPMSSRRAMLGVLLLIGLSLGSYLLYNRTPELGRAGETRLAILPLKPVSAENRDAIVEFAIAESLILKMSTAANLSVRPLSAVRKYVELDRDPIEAGRELNSDYVLSSNYQIVDGKIRVTSQLFDIRTGKTEATFSSVSDAANKFAMQDAIANEIGNAVFLRFGQTVTVYTAKRGTANEEAYRLYVQGQYLVDKKTQKDAERAIEIFDEALSLDPNFAHAWAGKAGAHCTFTHMGGVEPKLAFVIAKPALSKAFELDPNLAEGHAVLGIISFDYDWEFDKGLKHFRDALEINPQHEMARRWYANRLALLGRHDEALKEIKTVIDINPSSIFHQWDLANILYQARRYDEAIVQLQRVLEMDPNMAWASNLIWVAYHMKGDQAGAYEWFMKQQERRKTDPAQIEALRRAYALHGWNGVLIKLSAFLESGYKPDQYNARSSTMTLAAALQGNKDAAFKYAADGLKFRALWTPYLLHDPAFEILQQDPRFGKLLSDGGIPFPKT